MQRSVRDWGGNIVALLGVIVVNGLANAIPLGGKNTGEVSAAFSSLFTPAGYTFSIWGLIYAALLVFVIYQALPAQRSNSVLAAIGPWFLLGCAANAGWIFAWHYTAIALSMLLMLVLLGSLVKIYLMLPAAVGGQRWCVNLPFSLYSGWITVAAIANASALQARYGWEALGLSEINWTLLKLALAAAVSASVLIRRADYAFVLVVAWAAGGIFVRQQATPAVAGAALLLLLMSLMLLLSETVRSRLRA
jgi:hypothetical protein